MKIDTRYGSIWDELPTKEARAARKIPTTQSEAIEFYEAAQSSVDKSMLKTMDGHNDMVQKSAELRKISERKKALEKINIERREQQEEFFKERLKNSL